MPSVGVVQGQAGRTGDAQRAVIEVEVAGESDEERVGGQRAAAVDGKRAVAESTGNVAGDREQSAGSDVHLGDDCRQSTRFRSRTPIWSSCR